MCLIKEHSTPMGGPFDTWGGGGYGFSFVIKLFFSTPSLNVHFFSDLIKSKQFFLSGKTQKKFSPFISFDSLYTMLGSRGVTTFIWYFHHVFDKESYCVKYVEKNY